jgi:hypothetical protein
LSATSFPSFSLIRIPEPGTVHHEEKGIVPGLREKLRGNKVTPEFSRIKKEPEGNFFPVFPARSEKEFQKQLPERKNNQLVVDS